MNPRPRKIWLILARNDFDAGKDDWGHRDIRSAVYNPLQEYRDHSVTSGTLHEAGEAIVTAQWFALRRLGWTRAGILRMTETYGSVGAIRRIAHAQETQ